MQSVILVLSIFLAVDCLVLLQRLCFSMNLGHPVALDGPPVPSFPGLSRGDGFDPPAVDPWQFDDPWLRALQGLAGGGFDLATLIDNDSGSVHVEGGRCQEAGDICRSAEIPSSSSGLHLGPLDHHSTTPGSVRFPDLPSFGFVSPLSISGRPVLPVPPVPLVLDVLVSAEGLMQAGSQFLSSIPQNDFADEWKRLAPSCRSWESPRSAPGSCSSTEVFVPKPPPVFVELDSLITPPLQHTFVDTISDSSSYPDSEAVAKLDSELADLHRDFLLQRSFDTCEMVIEQQFGLIEVLERRGRATMALAGGDMAAVEGDKSPKRGRVSIVLEGGEAIASNSDVALIPVPQDELGVQSNLPHPGMQSMLNTVLAAQEENLRRFMGEFSGMIQATVSTEVQRSTAQISETVTRQGIVMNDVVSRLERLESARPPTPSPQPSPRTAHASMMLNNPYSRARGGPSAGSPDPWASYFAAQTAGRSSSGTFVPPPSGARSFAPNLEKDVFLADRIFLRGWAPFVRAAPDKGRSAGISREKCEQFWTAVREKLTEGQKSLILRTTSPFVKNTQLTITVRSGVCNADLWALRDSIDAVLKSKADWPGLRPGATLYASVDRPQWQKDRYSVTKSAEEILESTLPVGWTLNVDTNSGEIWGEKTDYTVLLGRYDKATNSWLWLDSELERVGYVVADVRGRFLALTQEF